MKDTNVSTDLSGLESNSVSNWNYCLEEAKKRLIGNETKYSNV
jgi:hypothetical protein